jgi:hypothetical protein
MYKRIQENEIRWPVLERHGIEVGEEARDLITKLLEKDKNQRLGQKTDLKEVLDHSFF